uniref:Uncharacterized protein n=1 Tax=Ascaris lumbricoides TaxID=6252 RepID=A0A0M3I0W9_ASCLU
MMWCSVALKTLRLVGIWSRCCYRRWLDHSTQPCSKFYLFWHQGTSCFMR